MAAATLFGSMSRPYKTQTGTSYDRKPLSKREAKLQEKNRLRREKEIAKVNTYEKRRD